MPETVLLIDASDDRRGLLRRALERRGCVISAEAGSVPELITAIAGLEQMPSTVLVGAKVRGASSSRVARLLKRTWPDATIIQESPSREEALAEAVGV
jgi:ActR/RegA family two-component response regulator